MDPEWAVIDEDDNDDPTYTIVGGNSNGRFTIHPTTGIITSTLEYDVDQGAMPDTDVLVVQVNIFLGLVCYTPHTTDTTVVQVKYLLGLVCYPPDITDTTVVQVKYLLGLLCYRIQNALRLHKRYQ